MSYASEKALPPSGRACWIADRLEPLACTAWIAEAEGGAAQITLKENKGKEMITGGFYYVVCAAHVNTNKIDTCLTQGR